MKSCRVSICQLPASSPHPSSQSRQKDNKYSNFMKKVSHLKHSTSSSTDSLTRSHLPYRENTFGAQRDVDIMLNNSQKKDEMFVVLKGKNFMPVFQNPSKIIGAQVSRTQSWEGLRLYSHVNLRGQNMRRTRVLKTIQRQKITRMQSQRKFLKKTLTVQLGLTIQNCSFL